MILHTDGSPFNGQLKPGQVWVKGNIQRTIVYFNGTYMWYKGKMDFKNDTVTVVKRRVFRRWLYGGAQPCVELSDKITEEELEKYAKAIQKGYPVRVWEYEDKRGT